MTEQATIRRCGNCDQPVGNGDVICPHCDVLLAAYEAPSGSTVGTASAINPVESGTISTESSPTTFAPTPPVTSGQREPRESYVSPTAQTLNELDTHKPQVGTTSTTFDLPQSSPVAKALEQTRIAAHLDPAGERSDETSIAPRTQDVAEDSRQLFGMSVKPIPAPQTSRPASPVTAPSKEKQPAQPLSPEPVAERPVELSNAETLDIEQIARAATASRQARPTPEQRAATTTPPVRPSERTPNTKTGSMPGVPTFIGAFIIIIFVARVVGPGALGVILLLPIVIVGLFWFMTRVAKNSGRKTTNLPKDKNRRK